MNIFIKSFFVVFSFVQVRCILTDKIISEKQFLLANMRASTSEKTQTETVRKLISRLLPNNTKNFNVSVIFNLKESIYDTDIFEIKKSNVENIVFIQGSSGVAAAMGLHFYLKYYCSSMVSWQTIQLNIPNILPVVDVKIKIYDFFRYYQNTCTTSYNFVWWTWSEWENHIDWMALNGINLPLALTATEAIWDRVYRKYYNLTDENIDDQFTGPAFLTWNRMSNIRGWAGPLSEAWHNSTLILQKKILKRMRDFGMYPILAGFAGTVPKAFKKMYPNAKINTASRWMNFGDKYCCPDVIEPSDPLFQQVGYHYMKELIAEFGTNHAYSADPFNELTPRNGSNEYLSQFAQAILNVMITADNKSVWVLQNWFFVNEGSFWNDARCQAFLSAIQPRHLLVLDLMSESSPQYNRLQNYYGHFYVWCMLHNFGGNLGMFGSTPTINKEIFNVRNKLNSTMLGTGLSMEGINQNYVVYDFMTESCWRNESVDLNEWYSNYSIRRYGKSNSHSIRAWNIIQNTVYTWNGGANHGGYIINQGPSTTYSVSFWYDINQFSEAWKELLAASEDLSSSESYLYDLVDVTRQALQILGQKYYQKLIKHFNEEDITKFQNATKIYLDVLNDLDKVLKTNKFFLLGTWLESAKQLSMQINASELSNYEFNARNLITLWGPDGQIKDYASKQWSGIVSDYFRSRWELYLSDMNESLIKNISFDANKAGWKVFNEIEKPFTTSKKLYPKTPEGFTIEIVEEIYEKWSKYI